MDEPNQKPTDEMLKEARRLAFFADEVLSQDIMNSYTKTKSYIKRHTQQLMEQEVIKPIENYVCTPEDIKIEKTARTIGSSIILRIFYIPALVYVALNWYFLITPINEWFANLGQFNPLLLEWFPRAQYWVNISTVYREKMILLYVIFQFFFWYSLIITIFQAFKNWDILSARYPCAEAKKRRAPLTNFFGLIIILALFGYAVFGNLSVGSELFLTYDQLDNTAKRWLFTDEAKWNSVFGFLFSRVLHLGLISLMLLVLIGSISTLFFKSKKNN